MPKGVNFIDEDDDERNSDSDSLLTGSPSPVFKSTAKKFRITPWITQLDPESDLISPSQPQKRMKANSTGTCKLPRAKKKIELEQRHKRGCQESKAKQNRSSVSAHTLNGLIHSTRENTKKLIVKPDKGGVCMGQETSIAVAQGQLINRDVELDAGLERLVIPETSSSENEETETWRVISQHKKGHFPSLHLKREQPHRGQPKRKHQNVTRVSPRSTTTSTTKTIQTAISMIILSDSDCDNGTENSVDISDEEFERVIQDLRKKRDDRNENLNHDFYEIRNPQKGVVSAEMSIGDTASTTQTGTASSSSTRRVSWCKKNETGHKGRMPKSRHVTEFVSAHDLAGCEPVTMPSSCSPSRRTCQKQSLCSSKTSLLTSSSTSQASSKKRTCTSSARGRGSSPGLSNQGAAKGTNHSMMNEEMAKKLQMDLDWQYAATLASGVSPSPRHRQPAATQAREGNVWDNAGHMEMRINRLTDWEWQLHLALVMGSDVPPRPPGSYEQSSEDALDSTLIEFLCTNPDAVNWRHRPNNQRQPTPHRHMEHRTSNLLPISLEEIDGGPDNWSPLRASRRRRVRRTPLNTRRNRRSISNDMAGLMGLSDFLFGRLQLPGHRNTDLNTTFADGNNYEELLALDDQLERVGLSAEQISRLPLTTYRQGSMPNTADGARCHVCMSDYEDGDRLRLLTCFHSFHCDCIDQWIKDNPTCPVCRIEVKV